MILSGHPFISHHLQEHRLVGVDHHLLYRRHHGQMERTKCRKEKILGSGRDHSNSSRSRLGYWLVVIATACSLTGCQHLKTGLATSAIVGATTALVPAAIVAPAVLGGVTAATVSAITAAPAQASEINADTVVQEAPANFFDLLGSLVEMGGWLLILIFVVPMLLGWLLPGPLTTHGKKKKKS